MSWASIVRTWFDDLFYSSHTKHLEAEILYLRNQCEQMRLDRDKLQLMLNAVTPAGIMATRQHGVKRPEQPNLPVVKRWAQIESERYAQIAADRAKQEQESKKEPVAQAA